MAGMGGKQTLPLSGKLGSKRAWNSSAGSASKESNKRTLVRWMITVENLWRWAEESQSADDPVQSEYAHSHCAKRSLKGATRDIEPSIFDEDDDTRLQ